MKFTFAMPHIIRLKASMQPWEMSVTGADQTRLAKAAEDLGYDMIAVPEHFLVPTSHLDLSGPHYFHAYAAMGYLAGATTKIRVNSCIAILPLQHPTVTAKALSTIDWMSSGRVTVGRSSDSRWTSSVCIASQRSLSCATVRPEASAAALIAPIEVPAIMSGPLPSSIQPCSTSASITPT